MDLAETVDRLKEFSCIDEHLVDAVLMQKLYPDTFHLPSAEEIASIDVGWNLHLNDGNHSFWTRVVHVCGDRLYATVENKTYEEGYDLKDKVSFRTCHVHVAADDKTIAQMTIQQRIDQGVEKEPSQNEKFARHLPNYLQACWNVFPDPFQQGVQTLEEAKVAPADSDKIVEHFVNVHPDGLKKMGLEVDDFAICHMNSKHELRVSLKDMKDKSDAPKLNVSEDTEADVERVYSTVMNLLLQTRIYAAAYDE